MSDLPCTCWQGVHSHTYAADCPQHGQTGNDWGWVKQGTGENPPFAVALHDQWQAEVMDVARDLAKTRLAALGIAPTEDQAHLLEAGYAVGYAATLVVMASNGWLRKP